MIEHYLWLTPVAVLAVLFLFRFVGCGLDEGGLLSTSPSYADAVESDSPVAFWQLQESDQTAVGTAFGLIAHAIGAASGPPPSAAVTPGTDTTGATLLVLSVTDFDQDSTTDTVSDSFGNTWHALKRSVDPTALTNLAIWYAWDQGGLPLVVGPGHTFTVSGAFSSIELTAWSGTKTGSDPFDQQNVGAAAGTATTAQPGSVTPSKPGSLVVTAGGFRAPGNYSVDAPYTVSDQKNYVDSVAMGSAQANFVQASAAATNPQWSTDGGATQIACAIASFLSVPTTLKASNEVGPPDGDLGLVSTPLTPDPGWHSNAIGTAVLQVGVVGPPPINAIETSDTSYRLNGGFVRVPYTAALNPAQFTLDMLVIPEWTLSPPDGKFYCVLESSGPAAPGVKNQGFALYAGPDDPTDPSSPSTWQFWVGDGSGFKRLGLKNPLAAGDPGLAVVGTPTYLAVTYSGSQAFLYIYYANRDLDQLSYELNYISYKAPVNQDLFIGISGPQRALFPPFPGPDPRSGSGFVYPFAGRIAEVAIYNTVLANSRLASHGMAAFTS